MNQRTIQILKYPAGMLLFAAAAALSGKGMTILPFGLFVFLCLSETVLLYTERGELFDLRILFTLSWLGGIALSTLKLSSLQSVWGFRMWTAVFLFYFAALFGNDLLSGRSRSGQLTPEPLSLYQTADREKFGKNLRSCAALLFLAGFVSFLIEAVVFKGELPILSDKPHAYTAFHITGIHYFIVSMMFVPAVTVLYFFSGAGERKDRILLLILSASVFLIYVLMLSKLQILLSLVFPAVSALLLQRRFGKRTVALCFLGLLVIMVAGFLLLMSMRHYPEGYLEGIFRFKDPSVPAAFQYVYTYVVNNFENLNLLTVRLNDYSFGIRSLFPVFALTGAKFLPQVQALLSVEQYLTCEELTTVTVLYDAYGDFGIAGTLVFGFAFGAFTGYSSRLFRTKRNVTSVLLYGQLAVYSGLVFFSTWFSNPTTWFWFAVTLMITFRLNMNGDGFRNCVRRTISDLRPPAYERIEGKQK